MALSRGSFMLLGHNTMKYDELLTKLGEFGRYQQFQYFLVCLIAITSSFHSMNMVFVGPTPEYRCLIKDPPEQWENLTMSQKHNLSYPLEKDKSGKMGLSRCLMFNLSETNWDEGNYTTWMESERANVSCPDGWWYATDVYKSTIVSEWDLVCDRKGQRALGSTLFFFGRLIGALISGQASDRYGRRPVFFVSVFLLILIGCGAALSPFLWLFYVLYFLQGVFQVSVYLSSYVLGTELVGPSYRKLAGMGNNFFYAIGQMILAGLAFGIQDWRWIEVAISLPALLFFSYYWLMPESVRWLLSQGRRVQALTILEKLARTNRVDVDRAELEQVDGGSPDTNAGGAKTYTVIDILKRWSLAKIALNVWISWMANALVYYGISLNTSNLPGSPYLNFFISACVEIPSVLLSFVLLDRLGRRPVYIAFLLFGGLSCFSTAFVPSDLQWVKTTLSMVGKFAITASYAIIYLVAAEVFPTVVRNVGVGMASVFARIGGMIAPQIVLLDEVKSFLPLTIFGILALVAGLLGLLLPETSGRPMAQGLDDSAEEGKQGEPTPDDETPAGKTEETIF